MFKQLLKIADGMGDQIKKRQQNGWNMDELTSYAAGYDNAFFDIVNAAELTQEQVEELENAVNKSYEKAGVDF